MKIKKGDNVIVMSGKDKGKTGSVVKAFPKEGKILIEGINLKKDHKRANKEGQKGQIVSVPAPIFASTVRIVDPKSGKPSKVGKKLVDGKYVRIAKKSGTTLDK